MRRILLCIGLLACFTACKPQQEVQKKMANPTVTIQTNMGDIQVELFEDKAPITVKNFLRYVDEKFYDHTIFHRVINSFMIQGGGFTTDFVQKPTHEKIQNEADNCLQNEIGTLAMARTSDVHSATGQFFINVSNNTSLNYRSSTPSGYGYCVFGKVTSGMDVVEKIKKVKTGSKNGHQDVPLETVEILSIRRNP